VCASLTRCEWRQCTERTPAKAICVTPHATRAVAHPHVGRCKMRRVVGARRPNLCASLACEKRHNSQAMSVDRHPDRIASTQRGVCAGGAVTLRGVTASAGYHSCHGYFSGVSLTPWRAHMGTSGAPDPCDDMPAREAGRPVTGIERYKAIAVRAGHPATWAEGLAGPMGRSTHRDARRWPDEQKMSRSKQKPRR